VGLARLGRARLNVVEDSAIQGAYAQRGAVEGGGAARSREAARVTGRPQVKHVPVGRGRGLEDEDEDARRWRRHPSRAGTGGERRSGAGNV
jgi:hypothetical protein